MTKIADIINKISSKLLKKSFDEPTLKYAIVGGFSAGVNLLIYYILNLGFGVSYLVSNIIAWFPPLFISFFGIKYYAFYKGKTGFLGALKEFFSFVASRIIAGMAENVTIWFLVGVLSLNSSLMKLVSSVVGVTLNYFLSLFIFSKVSKPKSTD